MELEDKFLDENYLATRLRDFKEIRNKEITFYITKSDRAYSNSLYINFCVNNLKFATLRISDHIAKTPHTSFVITQGKILSKKKREQFVKLVECVLRKAKNKSLDLKLKQVGGKVNDLLI